MHIRKTVPNALESRRNFDDKSQSKKLSLPICQTYHRILKWMILSPLGWISQRIMRLKL